jgi:hypothetical protein
MARRKQSPSTLLWFIRRKSYVPICEIRRRFNIDSDEGAFIQGDRGSRIYVGLPSSTAAAIEKLWRQGKIGLDLSVEFDCQVLIGVYPMVPVREESTSTPSRAPIINLVGEGSSGALAASE